MKKSVEFNPKGIVKMLNLQYAAPFLHREGVDELLREYPEETTRNMAYYMFMLGYIEGKRAVRARRKAVQHERSH